MRRRRARIQRREVERLTPTEQESRYTAMVDNLERLALQRLVADHPPASYTAGKAAWTSSRAEVERLRLAEQMRVIDEQRAAMPKGGADVLTRASAYLARADGSDAHAALQSVCYRITRGFALPEDVALDLLMREWVPRCSPRWKLHDVRRSVRGAARKGGETGWLLAGSRA